MRNRNSNRIRTALATNLGRCIAVLVAHDDTAALDEVLAGTGYRSISDLHTSADIGHAIAALTAQLDLDRLADVVHTASFHVALGDIDALDALDVGTRQARWELAEHAAATTLAECGRSVLERFLVRVNALTGQARAA